MRDFALLLLGVALAFASLAWGGYWLQRRRALKRGGPAPRALPGPEPAALPPPSPAVGELATPGAGHAAPEHRAELEPSAASRGAELGPAAVSRSAELKPAAASRGVELGPAPTSRDATLGPTEVAGSTDRRQTSAKGPRGAGPVEFLDEDTANAVEAAASAAASASTAAPGAAVVSVEPTSPSETAVAAAKPAAGADRAPAVVLVHGILGFDQFRLLGVRFHYFRGVADHLRGVGVNAYVVRLPALDAIPARGLALAEFVKSLPHDRVTLIAHSMGGLDARYAITHLGLAERVPVLVTVATPHHGTPLANLLARRTVSAARRLASKLGVRSEAIECLTTERMERFNLEVPDAPGVTYACVPCGRRARPGAIHPLLRPTYRYLRHVAGPNDGLVPVSSQLWGTVVEEIEADHWAQVGWSSRFDAPLFYADIVVHLAKLGLLPPPSFAELPAARSPLRLGPAPLPTDALATGAGLTTRPTE